MPASNVTQIDSIEGTAHLVVRAAGEVVAIVIVSDRFVRRLGRTLDLWAESARPDEPDKGMGRWT